MEPNKRALVILLMLVLTSVLIFFAEKKFLVAEPRGGKLSQYEALAWSKSILLLVEDFEGLSGDSTSWADAKIFSYGSAQLLVDSSQVDKTSISARSSLRLKWKGTDNYGGWGKGVGANMDLDVANDCFNFRVYVPESNGNDEQFKIILQEDDNDDGVLQEDKDDFWIYKISIPKKNAWQLVSIPLKEFSDENPGGDGVFNVTKKRGLHNIVFSFEQPTIYSVEHTWYFDFICFSGGKIIDNK